MGAPRRECGRGDQERLPLRPGNRELERERSLRAGRAQPLAGQRFGTGTATLWTYPQVGTITQPVANTPGVTSTRERDRRRDRDHHSAGDPGRHPLAVAPIAARRGRALCRALRGARAGSFAIQEKPPRRACAKTFSCPRPSAPTASRCTASTSPGLASSCGLTSPTSSTSAPSRARQERPCLTSRGSTAPSRADRLRVPHAPSSAGRRAPGVRCPEGVRVRDRARGGVRDPSSFNKAFRRGLGVSPSELRAMSSDHRRPALARLAARAAAEPAPRSLRLARAPRNRTAPGGEDRLRARARALHRGRADVWTKLVSRLAAARIDLREYELIGASYDDPLAVREEHLRYDAAVAVAPGVAPPPAPSQRASGGDYAAFEYRGPYRHIAEAFRRIFRGWVCASGARLRSAPCLELYRNESGGGRRERSSHRATRSRGGFAMSSSRLRDAAPLLPLLLFLACAAPPEAPAPAAPRAPRGRRASLRRGDGPSPPRRAADRRRRRPRWAGRPQAIVGRRP